MYTFEQNRSFEDVFSLAVGLTHIMILLSGKTILNNHQFTESRSEPSVSDPPHLEGPL